MKFKTIIIDDEENSIAALESLVSRYCPDLTVLEKFSDPRIALTYLQNNDVDLVFLDIQMPFLSGLDLVKELVDPKCNIIFTTAYDQYAIDAIKLSALDYLLKPIDPELLIKGVSRFLQDKTKNQDQSRLTHVLANLEQANPKRMVIQLQEKTLFLEISDILFLEADSNYTKFHMKDEKVHLTSKTIKYFQEHLENHQFFRPHQSFLVNASFISEYNKSDNSLVLSNGTSIPVSKNKKEELFKVMRQN